MSHTHRNQRHKFDDEQTSGRSVRHANHVNNHKFHGIPVIGDNDKNIFEKLENDVDSSINSK